MALRAMKRKIKIEPVPQGRARQRFVNGMVITYTPGATVKAQKAIKEAITRRNLIPFEPLVPLKLSVTFYRQKSKWLRRRETMPFRKPDLDNYLKLLLDALNGVAFADDAQITTIIVKKRWTPGSQAVKRGKDKPPESKGYIELTIVEDKL